MSNYKQLARTIYEDRLMPAAKELIAAYGDGELSTSETFDVVGQLVPEVMEWVSDFDLPNAGSESKRSLVSDVLTQVVTELLSPDSKWIPNFIEKPLDALLVRIVVGVLCDQLHKAGIG